MNISWQWLAELVDLRSITPEYLAEKLTLASFEVESITNNFENDTILEISTTANRADTLSMIGIAREIAAILGKPFTNLYKQQPLAITNKQIDKKNTQCSHHIYTTINNINIKESPQWLQKRLISQGIKPENNIADIVHFIGLKWGQQIDVFDLDKITKDASDNIHLDLKSEYLNDHFISRHDNTIINDLHNKITTVQHNQTNIALAGISTSTHSSISHQTSNIIVQATICDRLYIKKRCKQLNFYTNSSKLQEKGINPCDLLDGYNEAILLIRYLCNGVAKDTIYASTVNKIYPPIYLNTQDINEILGSTKLQDYQKQNNEFNLKTIFKILNNLNLITYIFADYLQINVPLSRIEDIYREIDILEEIIRIYGFNEFIDAIPLQNQYGTKTIKQYKLLHIRSILRSMGIHETMHSSLIPYQNPLLQIYNPLTEEYNTLKDNLIFGLINSYIYNNKQGNGSIEIFETGRVFNKSNIDDKYIEKIHLAGLLGGIFSNRSSWSEKPVHLSWFQAKGDMEEIFERLNIKIIWKTCDKKWFLYNQINQYFHPQNIATLFFQDKPIGIFGEINFGFSQEIYTKIYGFEIIIDDIYIQKNHIKRFKEYSKYPSIFRDINIKITDNTSYSQIINKINSIKHPLIESMYLFDVYQSTKNYKNLSLRITYRSPTKTLTSSEIEVVEQKIKNSL